MTQKRTCKLARAALVLCALAPALPLYAQMNEVNTAEVAGFAGGMYGLAKTHPVVGASTGLEFSRNALGVVEAVYSPLSGETLRGRAFGAPDVQSSKLFDFNGSLHIRVPVKKRWAPYGIVGAGMLLNTYRTGASVTDTNFAFHTGAGLRYYVKQNWGIRPELKVILSNQNYTRFTVGIFYHVEQGWPW